MVGTLVLHDYFRDSAHQGPRVIPIKVIVYDYAHGRVQTRHKATLRQISIGVASMADIACYISRVGSILLSTVDVFDHQATTITDHVLGPAFVKDVELGLNFQKVF